MFFIWEVFLALTFGLAGLFWEGIVCAFATGRQVYKTKHDKFYKEIK